VDCPKGCNETVPQWDKSKKLVCTDSKSGEEYELAVVDIIRQREDGSGRKVVSARASSITRESFLSMDVQLPAYYVPYTFDFALTWKNGGGKTNIKLPGTVSAVESKSPELVKSYYGMAPELNGNTGGPPGAVGATSVFSTYLNGAETGHFSPKAMDSFMERIVGVSKSSGYSSEFVTVSGGESDKSKAAGLETMLDVEWMSAVAPNLKLEVLFRTGKNAVIQGLQQALDDLIEDKNRPGVFSISYGAEESPEALASFEDLNNKLIAAGSVGVSVIAASGDRGSFGFEFKQCSNFMTALFPGSSPFVTSVGATTLVADEASQCPGEDVASANVGGSITSGGGFSAFFAAESYQSDTVRAYLKSKECAFPSKKSFQSSMRAYPDIAVMGNLFPVALGDKDEDWYWVDGTSASAPVFAAFIALIHDARQKKGISPTRIGFLNLYLYEAFKLDSANFKDIVSGSTSCVSRAVCCNLGFEACPGYDAASGLGSPDWRALGKIFYDGEDLPLGSPGDPKVVGCGSDVWMLRSYWFWGVVGVMLVGCLAAVIYMRYSEPTEERLSEYLLDGEELGGQVEYQPPKGQPSFSANESIN
jgi:hypothetical protein